MSSLFKDNENQAVILASCIDAGAANNSAVDDIAKFALKLFSEVKDNFEKFEESQIEDLNK